MMSTLGQPTPVAQITAGLRALWETDHAKSRAALMNLVIYTEDGTPLEEMAADAQRIAAEQACRALLIKAHPCGEGGELPPKAWITAHCRLGEKGGGLICCEQVAFELCARDNDQLRNIVFAHLDSDLPLVFWWRGELSANFEEQLTSRFERLIVDSDSWTDPGAAIGRAAGQSGAHYVLHDLAWSRTHALRLAIADCFEAPEARRALPEVSGLRITHAPENTSSAGLLARWFACQLGWEDLRAASITRLEPAPGAPVSRVEITAGGCQFDIRQDGSVTATSSLVDHKLHQVLPAGPMDNAGIASEVLARGGRNELYLKVATSQ